MAVSLVKLPLGESESARAQFYLLAVHGRIRVADFLGGLQAHDFSKMLKLMRRFAESGWLNNEEHFKALSGYSNLYEFKTHGVRVFCFLDDGRVVLVEGCMKKSSKADSATRMAIERAERGKKLYFDRKSTGGITYEQ